MTTDRPEWESYARERADLPDGLYANGDTCGAEEAMTDAAWADRERRRGW